MSFKYSTKKKGNGITSEEKYYAYPTSGKGIVKTFEIAEQIAARSSLTPGDIYNTIINLSEIMQSYFETGQSVKLDNLGIFSVSISSEGYNSPEEITPHRVKVKKICFRADKKMKNKLDSIKFKRTV